LEAKLGQNVHRVLFWVGGPRVKALMEYSGLLKTPRR
jgi:hypothetical protein